MSHVGTRTRWWHTVSHVDGTRGLYTSFASSRRPWRLRRQTPNFEIHLGPRRPSPRPSASSRRRRWGTWTARATRAPPPTAAAARVRARSLPRPGLPRQEPGEIPGRRPLPLSFQDVCAVCPPPWFHDRHVTTAANEFAPSCTDRDTSHLPSDRTGARTRGAEHLAEKPRGRPKTRHSSVT